MLNPYLPIYFGNIGFSNIQIGLLMSVGPLVSLLANPFWGFWSDRMRNTRFIISVLLIGNILTSQIFFQMHWFYSVFVFMLLFYFFQTALNPLSNSLILHLIENTEQHFGTFRLWGSIGFALMAIASSPIIGRVGVGNLGWIYGGFVVITLLISLRLPRQSAKSGAKKASLQGLSVLLRSGVFLTFLILSILMSIPNRMNATFVSVYVMKLGGSEVLVGWSWFFAAITEVPVFMLLDRFLKKNTRTMFGLLALISLLFVLRWLLMIAAASPQQIIMIQLMQGVTFGMAFYTGTQLCDALVPERFRSTGLAIYSLAWMGLGGIIGGLLGGWLYDELGPKAMYTGSLILSFCGFIGFFALWQYERRREPKKAISPGAV